jgi:hypothetical protein
MYGTLLAFLWFSVVMYIDIQTDYKRIETNTIKHGRGLILRSLGLLPSFGCLYFPLESLVIPFLIVKAIVIIGLLGSVYWEFFDGLLNKKRNKPWRYNGSDDPNDASTDNFLQSLTPKQQRNLKWWLIITFITTYIVLKLLYVKF